MVLSSFFGYNLRAGVKAMAAFDFFMIVLSLFIIYTGPYMLELPNKATKTAIVCGYVSHSVLAFCSLLKLIIFIVLEMKKHTVKWRRVLTEATAVLTPIVAGCGLGILRGVCKDEESEVCSSVTKSILPIMLPYLVINCYFVLLLFGYLRRGMRENNVNQLYRAKNS